MRDRKIPCNQRKDYSLYSGTSPWCLFNVPNELEWTWETFLWRWWSNVEREGIPNRKTAWGTKENKREWYLKGAAVALFTQYREWRMEGDEVKKTSWSPSYQRQPWTPDLFLNVFEKDMHAVIWQQCWHNQPVWESESHHHTVLSIISLLKMHLLTSFKVSQGHTFLLPIKHIYSH